MQQEPCHTVLVVLFTHYAKPFARAIQRTLQFWHSKRVAGTTTEGLMDASSHHITRFTSHEVENLKS